MDDEEEDDIFFFREIENNIYMYFQFLEKMMWTFNKKNMKKLKFTWLSISRKKIYAAS